MPTWTLVILLALPPAPVQYRFERISVEDGLSQSSVFCILQDHLGYMWFGTQDGLNLYDGYRFRIFKRAPDNPQSLASNWINCLFEDRQNNLWVGTREGLHRFQRDSGLFPRVRPSSALNIRCLLQLDSAGILVGTTTGLYLWEGGAWTQLIPDLNILSLLGTQAGNVLVGSAQRGLDIYDLKTRSPRAHPLQQEYQLKDVNALYRDRDDVLWVGTYEGLLKFDPANDSLFKYENVAGKMFSLSGNVITFILQDAVSGFLWVGTRFHGLNLWVAQEGKFYRFQNDPANEFSLGHNSVWSVHQDRSGVIWIGTGTSGGLNKLVNPGLFKHISQKPYPDHRFSLSHSLVWALYQNEDEDLWVGTWGGLDCLNWKTGKVRRYKAGKAPQGLTDDKIFALAGSEHNLWVGTYHRGLNKLDLVQGTIAHYRHDPKQNNSLSHDRVTSLLLSGPYLWITTALGGLNRFHIDDDRFFHYRHDPQNPNSISSDQLWVAIQDKNQNLWLGTNGGGLNYLNPRSHHVERFFHDPSNPESISSNYVGSLLLTDDGDLWVGTMDGGLNHRVPGTEKFMRFTESNSGLPNNTVYGILEDDRGDLWMSTNRGLSRLSRETNEIENYSPWQGLQHWEFNLGCAFKNRVGDLFFGGINGINFFNPSKHGKRNFQAPLEVACFQVLGQDRLWNPPLSQPLRLSHRENSFSVELAALDYAHPPSNRYAYKLIGFEREWHQTSGENPSAIYTSIPPGSYRLAIKGSNSHGRWNPRQKRVSIRISSPFYKTQWFYALVVLGICLFLFLEWLRRKKTAALLNQRREADRKMLALEIHNGPLQDLAGLNLFISRLSRILPEWLRDEGRRMKQKMNDIQSSLRDIMWQLRPSTLDDFGLEHAVHEYLEKSKPSSLHTSLSFPDATGSLSPGLQNALFRISQVAIDNALKHARATQLHLSLKLSPRGDVHYQIEDNGRGFILDEFRFLRSKHMGILGAQEQAKRVGGSLKVRSRPGKGTKITFKYRVPFFQRLRLFALLKRKG